MSAILLAPYNDSMRLGAGYNSFLQTPCLGNAVRISGETIVKSPSGKKENGVSQSVSYSSSFVEKMSEVVRSMNISAGSSIRTGSVNTSAGSSSVDEAKFAESDLNAVLSVKVINQTRTIQDEPVFNPVNMKDMTADKFHSIYGDTFISGFIEGGDLYGIVSIKILEQSRKEELKKQLKSQFNGGTSDWSPSSSGQLSSSSSETEVTITVNYAGGGLVKSPEEEWTLESLMASAAAFPAHVASCPQRTSAILSRYNTVPSFVEWMSHLSPAITIRRYEGVQRYTSELLDTFIEYKSILYSLNDAIQHPDSYEMTSSEYAVKVNLGDMVYARRGVKAEMEKMVKRIEDLDTNPDLISKFLSSEAEDDIEEPEICRSRLPVKKDPNAELAAQAFFRSFFGDQAEAPAATRNGTAALADHIELGNLKEKNTTLDMQLQEALKNAARLEEKLEKNTGLDTRLQEAQRNVERLQGELQTASKNVERLGGELQTTSRNVERLEGELQTASKNMERFMEQYEGRRFQSSDGTIFLVLDRKARHLVSGEVWQALFGGGWDGISRETQALADLMPKGPPLTANPMLIRPAGGGPTYFVDEGKKRWIVDPETFAGYGFNSSQVVAVDAGMYPDGPQIKK